MQNAQDRAFALLAARRGLAALEALGEALQAPSVEPAAQRLVACGLLSAEAASSLLRELTRGRFACAGCGSTASFGDLARASALTCRCGGALEFRAPEGRPSGRLGTPPARLATGPAAAARAGSGHHVGGPPPSGRYGAPPPPTGGFPGVSPPGYPARSPSPSGGYPGVAPPPSGGAPPPSGRPSSSSLPAVGSRSSGALNTSIGGYALQGELGRGSWGIVFLARKPGIERRYALKVLPNGGRADAETVARFQLEAAIGSKLQDPNVIGVFDVGRHGEHLYYAMEHCPGPTLKDQLRTGRMSPQAAAELVREIAAAVARVHAQDVLHRDLKPSNIILEEGSGRPRITDFGLARDRTLMQTMTRTGDVLGTPYYMAPEQLRGDKDVDRRADVYALGVILFECLTGGRPYDAGSVAELTELVCRGAPKAPRALAPDLPEALERICMLAMHSDRTRRTPTAGALAAQLEEFLRGAAEAPRTPAAERRSRLPLVPLVAGGLVLAAAAATAGALIARRSSVDDVDPSGGAAAVEGGPRRAALDPAAARALLSRVSAGLASGARLDAAGLASLRAQLDEAAHLGGDEPRLKAELVELRAHFALEEGLSRLAERARAGRSWAELAQAAEDARAALATPWGQQPESAPLRARFVTEVAAVLLRRGRAARALEELRPLRAEPGSGTGAPTVAELDAHVLRARALEALGRRDEARAEYEAVAALDRGDRNLCARAALARLDGAPAAAEEHAASARRSDAPYPPLLLELARSLLAQQRGDAARAAFTRLREMVPDEPWAAIGLADLALVAGDDQAQAEAARADRLLEEDDPPALALVRALGHARRDEREEHDEARAQLNALLERAPDHVAARVHRGVLARRQGRAEEAVEDWRRAHELDADRARAVLERWYAGADREAYLDATSRKLEAGALAYVLGEVPDEVRQNLERRVASHPGPLRAELLQAFERAARARPVDEIAQSLGRAARMAPDDPGFLLERVRLLSGRDAVERARGALEDARARLPEGGPARLELARLAGELLWREGELGAAGRALEAVADEDPQGRTGRLALAAALCLKSDWQGALGALEGVQGADEGFAPQAATALTLKGMALLGVGKASEALAALNQAFALEGALDSRLLAARAVALQPMAPPPAEPSSPFDLMFPGRGAPRGVTGPGDHFGVSEGPFCRLVAASLYLASDVEAIRELGEEALDEAGNRGSRRADVALLRGYAALRADRSEASVAAYWRAAKDREGRVPIPPAYLRRYREAFGSTGGFDELR